MFTMKEFTLVPARQNLDLATRQLVDKAASALLNAYAPYSAFRVGAAVLLDNGTIVTGMNQENASYPAGLCAERVALYAAYASHPQANVVKVAVAAQGLHDADLTPATCCGECRQVLLEFENRQQKAIEIIMLSTDGWVLAPSAASLLPFAFSSAHLNAPKP
jgi:cytidine deaminase